MSVMRLPATVRTTAVRAAALAAGAGLVAGCGIRGTAVPVDAGSAPSRATCVVRPAAPQSDPLPGSAVMSVQLLCGSQLLPVPRSVALPESGESVGTARALLEELQRQPSPVEDDAGFATDVPQRLTVRGSGPGDPAGTLRLGVKPDELPPVALAQLVCTYAGTAAADGKGTVVLGGPDDEKPRGFTCTEETRTHPERTRSTGAPVS
ncbi:hypothetical protein BLA24_26645 [Streptomyces cinnamoneus]|uniref:Lipoprotein n=1 Tax=Streptomyces cinnamoneus TaxID=53446 RepID=A0A2G1XEF2_STRCJ|nr:hypothetical protein [Streptomyces cinnamoneus]PHQ49602.1 hypothetical protein BLA24_26645 [Streptomyces cinnamoneus]PPT14678.1 hypothetical protein CYQ11_18990 [Streptomyces cinnamoneus]